MVHKPSWFLLLHLLALAASAARAAAGDGYYGKYIGQLKTLHHGVSGEVFAVDARTLHIRNFNYDGEGPAAFFYAGDSKSPNGSGFRISDEKGTFNVLPRYRNKHITLTLPENKTLRDIRWFSVWCDEFSVNFGDVRIPKAFDFPRPQKVDALRGAHGVASDSIVVVDAQTLLVPAFSYDGEAPDAKFWVGRGSKPGPQGTRVPDENGKESPLRRYVRKTIVLTLPGQLTVYDIGHFGVWCEAFTVDFGHVRVPRALNVPPSLKMLGVSPQSKLNCEVLWDENAFEVRWAVAGDSVVVQLVAKVEDGEYMSFGLSGADDGSRMDGGDVGVAWVNHSTLAGDAQDYFLESKAQCSGGSGVCPDWRFRENTNSIRMLNAAMVNGYSIVTYQRPLHAQDELDRAIVTNGSQPIIWALGPLNARGEASYHRVANRHDVFIDFARSPKWNCPIPDSEGGGGASGSDGGAVTAAPTAPARPRPPAPPPPAKDTSTSAATATSDERSPGRRPSSRPSSRPPLPPAAAPSADAWDIPAIQCYEPEDGVFYAQMGPTGGKRGYSAITGHVGWGISWYINGLLIPEIHVVRGKTYTFVVEGGNDPDTPARYHPFYVTDDPVGGYQHKTPDERNHVRVLAGVRVNRRGEAYPTGTGRLCNWTPDQAQPPADEFASFGAYQRTLTLECDQGEAGVVQWTPDRDTPDTVYYQCYTHRYLGWKIQVHDSCDAAGSASEPQAARAPARDASHADDELESRPSIRVSTRVRPHASANSVGELYSPPGQQYIPLISHHVESNSTTDYPIKPSPADLMYPGTAEEARPTLQPSSLQPSSLQPSSQPFVADSAFDHPDLLEQAPGYSTTAHSILPTNTTKTTDIKLLSSTAKPAQSTEYDHLLLDSDLDGLKATSEASTTIINSPTFLYKRPLAHRPHGLTPHGYILPNGRPVTPMGTHAMMLHRPQAYGAPYRRPVPHRGYVPLHRPAASVIRPTYISTPLPPNYVMTSKKPFYRVTMMSVPHRPMVSPPPFHRPHSTLPARPLHPTQQQFASSFKNAHYSLPPQRIKYDKLQALASTSKPEGKNSGESKKVETISPAPLLSTSTESVGTAMPVAVNTGFRPESVVVEGGFKPIINKNIAQDRSSVESDIEFVDQDRVVEKLEEEILDELVEKTEAAEDRKDNPFEGQQPEAFEPIFIPSPPDRHSRRNASALRSQPRGHEDAPGEMAMAAERMDTYYLPPGAVVAYDGKSVVDVSLASSIASPQPQPQPPPSGTAELVRGTPQFGPFLGQAPPPVPPVVHPETLPQLQNKNKQHAQVLPHIQGAPKSRLFAAEETLSPAATQIKGEIYESKHKHQEKKTYPPVTQIFQEDMEEATTFGKLYSSIGLSNEETVTNAHSDVSGSKIIGNERLKREAQPHHEPGHTGSGEEDLHIPHDSSQHSHSEHDQDDLNHDHKHNYDHTSKSQMASRNPTTTQNSIGNVSSPELMVLNLSLIVQIARYFS